jgi:capsular exopolysaccharide synthesis family protein
MGDGKTTLVINLAASIAQSGKRILVIDGDLRRPRLHQALGTPSHTGLASVMAGQSALGDAVRETAVPGLWVLPCGPPPPNPAELLTSPRFKDVLDVLRTQYDFVLIDTPPLLAVTDPCAVAPRVDGVLLTIRLSRQAAPQAVRAREILATLGARVLGVIVNGAGTGGPGRYGAGHYEYAYAEDGYEPDGAAAGADYYEPGAGANGTGGEGPDQPHPPRAAARRRPPAAAAHRSGILRRFLALWV